jgi:hypothetical protein
VTSDEREYFRVALLGVFIANLRQSGHEVDGERLTQLLEHDVDKRLGVYDRFVQSNRTDVASILERAFRMSFQNASVTSGDLTRADGIIEQYEATRPR